MVKNYKWPKCHNQLCLDLFIYNRIIINCLDILIIFTLFRKLLIQKFGFPFLIFIKTISGFFSLSKSAT
jgi:hypothetical protein